MGKWLSFHVKFAQTDRPTKGWPDGQTKIVKQYAPDLSIRGHKKKTYLSLCWNLEYNHCLNFMSFLGISSIGILSK